MYHLAPINDENVSIEVPDIMYKVKPINNDNSKSRKLKPTNIGRNAPICSVEELEFRQERVLQNLNNLKSQLSSYKVSFGLSPIPTHFESTKYSSSFDYLRDCQSRVLDKIYHLQDTIKSLNSLLEDNCLEDMAEVKKNDLVICAHPDHPPYGLILICNQLKTFGLVVYCSSHYHSSITEPVSEQVQDFFPPNQENVTKNDADLVLTVIWRMTSDRDPYTVVDPLKKSVIKGEVNIIRLITRSYPSVWTITENLNENAYVEGLLDSIHKNLIWKNVQDPEAVAVKLFESLECRLTADSVFFSGKPIPGPLDILLWSYITSVHGRLPYPVTSNKQWLNSCNKICAQAFTREKRRFSSRRHSSYRNSRRRSSTKK